MEHKKILINGASGFLGKHLVKYLHNLNEKIEVICSGRKKISESNCDKFITADITNRISVGNLIKSAKPDYIIQLAGVYNNDKISKIYNTNTFSMISLLEAVYKFTPNAIVILIGSAAEYGKVNENQLPIKESIKCNPISDYGKSKYLATQIALYYSNLYNLNVMIVRPFLFMGKGIGFNTAPGAFSIQLNNIIEKKTNIIRVGNLNTYRDIIDVRDAAEAIWKLSCNPVAGEIFNVCSGNPIKMGDLLQNMIDYLQLDIEIKVDKSLLRDKKEIFKLYGSYQKIYNHCGWRSKINLDQSIRRLFN